MSHRCPTCMADLSEVVDWRCPECGASRRETYDAQTDELGDLWPDPEPAPEPTYDSAARCQCSHARISHTGGAGNCWSVVCGCRSYRPKETAA